MRILLRSVTLLLCIMALVSNCTTPSMPDPDPAAPSISRLIPSVIIPGRYLTLSGTNLSSVKDIDFTDENGVAVATIPALSFVVSATSAAATGSITIKVPTNISASYVRINNEHGNGNLRSISNMYSSDALTTSNMATNVGVISTGTIADGCLPASFFYCLSTFKELVGFKHHSSQAGCYTQAYDTVTIGGKQYEVFGALQRFFDAFNTIYAGRDDRVQLKMERKGDGLNLNGDDYTGSVIITVKDSYADSSGNNVLIRGGTYVGNILKSGDIDAYSVDDGRLLRMCKRTSFNAGLIKGYPNNICPDCSN